MSGSYSHLTKYRVTGKRELCFRIDYPISPLSSRGPKDPRCPLNKVEASALSSSAKGTCLAKTSHGLGERSVSHAGGVSSGLDKSQGGPEIC